MSTTLSDILIGVNAYTDLEASEPTGTELTTRVEFGKQAVREWANAYQWPELSKVWVCNPSLASISLPTDFKEFECAPQLLENNAWVEYPEVKAKDKYGKGDGEKYSFILGNETSGYTLVLNNLTANCTLSINYQALPSLMATLPDTCVVPDPDFVKTRIISYILQSRSDDRFPTVSVEANRLLMNMMGRSYSPKGGINKMPRNTTWRLE